MSSALKATGIATFRNDVIETSKQIPVVVDFWAAWCGPCRTLGPILESVAAKLGDRARIVKVDTDAEQALAGQFGIRSIPTVMLFRDGKLAGQFVGVQPENAILDWVKPFLAVEASSALARAVDARGRGDEGAARVLLLEALSADTNDHAAREELADLELAAGHATEAQELLDALPIDHRNLARPRSIAARLYFAAELGELGRAASDLDQLYGEGLKAAAAGRAAVAAEALLTLTRRSRAYRDDAGRKALLRLFDVLGPDHEVTADYRRKLAQTLH